MPRRPASPCTWPGCRQLVDGGGRCADHLAAARRASDQARGSARERGYDRDHEELFRTGVLDRDPVCVLCQAAPSTVADHYPRSRRQLVDLGLDPNDPDHGRGLCHDCHSSETARRQPGGWHRTRG